MRLAWPSAALVAACYSPTAQQGAPCNAVTDVCPFQQTCQLSGTEYMCTNSADRTVFDGPKRNAWVVAVRHPLRTESGDRSDGQ